MKSATTSASTIVFSAVYGLNTNVFVGALNGPSLWLGDAALNIICGVASSDCIWPKPVRTDTDLIVSPTWKVPLSIVISNNFGTIYDVTFLPSKNANILVSGFNPEETNWILRERINDMRSLLITLSPCEVLSNCSSMNNWVPCLVDVPVSNVSVVVSWKVVVSVSCVNVVVLPDCDELLLTLVISVLVSDLSLISTPVHWVSHDCHRTGVRPDWGSNPPNIPDAIAMVSAKLPSCSIIFASTLAVSTHVSDAGVRSIVPVQ